MIKTVKRVSKLPKYTYLGCTMTRNRTPWCFRICPPDANGLGKCGRIAPHTLKGNIQLGIIKYEQEIRRKLKEKEIASSFELKIL